MRAPRRVVAVLISSVAIAAFGIGPAAAGNAHFVKAAASLDGYDLRVTFKEAGLASGSVETVQANASYTAVFQCINGGKKNPSAANKSTESGASSASGTFSADRNGNINGTLIVEAPSVDSNALECPNGQTEQLSQITWSGISVADLTSGAFRAISGTFSVGSVV